MTITQVWSFMQMVIIFSVGANLFLMKKAHEDGLVDDVVAQSIDKLHYSF